MARLNISYQRRQDRNYLVIEASEREMESYEYRMLRRNRISGLLTVQERQLNGEGSLFYDITGKQCLFQLYRKAGMDGKALRAVLHGLLDVLKEGGKYFLDGDCFLADPELIFIDRTNGAPFFVCYAGYDQQEGDPEIAGTEETGGIPHFGILAEFILKHLDHKDEDAVSLGYAFYQGVFSGDQKLTQVLKEILGTTRFPENTGKRDESAGNSGSETAEITKTGNSREQQNGSGQSSGTYPGSRMHTPQKKTQRTKRRKELFLCLFACLSVFGVNLFLDLFFRFDLTQIGGLAFLSIAVLWLLYIETIGKQKENQSPWEGILPETDPEEEWEEDPEEEESFRAFSGEKDEPAGAQDDLAPFLRDQITQQKNSVRNNRPVSENERTGNSLPEEDVTRILVPQTDFDGAVLIGELSGTAPLYLESGQWILGKSAGQADICIPLDSVSRIHAQAEVSDGNCTIMDLNSQNGTFVNGKRLEPHRPFRLQPGDHIRFAQAGYIMT